MSCLIAVISVSEAVRIADTRLLSALIESVSVRIERVTSTSCARCTESAALEPARETMMSCWSLSKSCLVAKKQPLAASRQDPRMNGVALIIANSFLLQDWRGSATTQPVSRQCYA